MTPTTSPAASIGALTRSTVSSVCFASLRIISSDIAFNQRRNDQSPSVYHNEQKNLEWQRYHHRRQLHHAHRQQDRRHDHIDDQKWKKQHETDLKSGLDFRNHECRNDRAHRQIIGTLWFCTAGQVHEELQILLPGTSQHELLERL